jgi:hypothetical protein
MNPAKSTGIQFRAVWFDDDATQLFVFGWNGSFGGTASVYEGTGDLEKAAEHIRGFPRNPTDMREVVFGTLDRKCAGGGVKLRFHCIGGAGHAFVEAKFDANCDSAGTIQTAVLSMPVEAEAVDRFVQELQIVGANRAGEAYLKATE